MKTVIKICALLLLLITAIGAIYGGTNLITHTDGSGLKLSVEWLKYTPFDNYLIPGIILLVANGLLSLVAFLAVCFNAGRYPLYVFAQGVILTIWILVQVLLIRTVIGLHFIMGGIGIMLMICGWQLTGYRVLDKRSK